MAAATTASGFSIIVPTLNEAANLPELLGRIAAACPGPGVEVVVVDDASRDGTPEVARAAGAQIGLAVTVIERRGPRSLALAVVEGAGAARHETVVVMDADLSHPPERIPALVAPILDGSADVVIGSRHAAGGAVGRWPLRRRILSAMGTALARSLTGVRDPLSGFFATRRDLLAGRAAKARGYKVLLDLLARGPALRDLEVPIEFRDRAAGESKLGPRQSWEFLVQFGALAVAGFISRLSHRGSSPRKQERLRHEET
jgi:dolichol-phosphate mannosyltransferase